MNEKTGNLAKELKREILKLAARYKTKSEKDNFQEYTPTNIKD